MMSIVQHNNEQKETNKHTHTHTQKIQTNLVNILNGFKKGFEWEVSAK